MTSHTADLPAPRPLPVVAIAWAAALIAVAAVGGLATDTSSSWYEGLDLPAFQPPGAAFGIVWTVLYAMIAVAGVLLTRSADTVDRTRALTLLGGNLVLNVAWTWIFFQAHAPVAAGVEILVLLATTLALIAVARRVHRTAALLLLPYAVWVTFASVLTWTIALTN